MMWDAGGSGDPHRPPVMQMPGHSFPISPPETPFSGAFPGPSSYPPMPGMAPTYIPMPQYERAIYYGNGPPPPSMPQHGHSYAYDLPQPEHFEHYERVRAHSHSHSNTHTHSHSQPPQTHSYHPSSYSHPHSHSTRPPPPPEGKPRPAPPRPEAKHRSSHKTSHTIPQDPLNADFQYSKCTGHKKALCIGINYKGQKNPLRGCINDAVHVRKFLIDKNGYKDRDIVILTDDAKNPRSIPTRKNILDAMKWLVRGAKTNDSLFFHYSGHGGQTQDLDGDEVDGWDEVIYPVDFQKNGHIVDDEMHDIMVKPLPRGCRLTALFDSCHSGTVLDLPYIYSSHGRLKGTHVSDRMRKRLTTPSDVISWSGCKDGQTSADTFSGGVAVGAMSYAFITTLTRNPKQTYQELLRSVRLILNPRFSQKPQLGSSHPIDTSLRFVL